MGRRSTTVALGVTAALAGTLTAGYLTRGDDYRGVCVDEQTQVRLPDDDCDDDRPVSRAGGSVARWYYVRSDQRMPAVGQKSSGVPYVPDGASVKRGGVSVKGGKVSRGGFGGFGIKGGS